MAKIMRLSLSLSVIALLLLAGQLRAEDYVSKDVPPDEIIMKALYTQLEKRPDKDIKLEK